MSTNDDGYDTMYRVMVDDGKNCVRVQCIGMYCLDSDVEDTYSGLEKLPQWMQEKVALLMMTPLDKPTSEVEAVGRRIDDNVYWIFRV